MKTNENKEEFKKGDLVSYVCSGNEIAIIHENSYNEQNGNFGKFIHESGSLIRYAYHRFEKYTGDITERHHKQILKFVKLNYPEGCTVVDAYGDKEVMIYDNLFFADLGLHLCRVLIFRFDTRKWADIKIKRQAKPKAKNKIEIKVKSKEVSVKIGDSEVWGVVRDSGFEFKGARNRKWERSGTPQELREHAECWLEMVKCVENFKKEDHG